jgi:hypothetical protein
VLLLCESLTMAVVLVLWTIGMRRGKPMAPTMVVAILASGLAGVVFALPEAATTATGLDPTSLSHLAQIPGPVLLGIAVERGRAPTGSRRLARLTGEPAALSGPPGPSRGREGAPP